MKKRSSSFWQDAHKSMRPSVRARYLPYFVMARNLEETFDAIAGLWHRACMPGRHAKHV